MKPSIGISEKQLHHSIAVLQVILSDEMLVYIKTRQFHWNVSGESFMEIHKLFQAQYTESEETIDLIAERINKLGGKTIGTMKEFLHHTRLKESPGHHTSQKQMMKNLLEDHEAIIVYLRKTIEKHAKKNNDIGTADLLTGITAQHETTAWILRRYL